MAYANATRAAHGGITDRLNALLKSFRTASVKRRMYNQTYRELNALTERELSDLGIHRTLIGQIAAEAAYGK